MTIKVASLGAELKSLKKNDHPFEWMWQGLPRWWGRTSPVLFPVVGKSSENRLMAGGKEFPMPQHGFARDQEFALAQKNADSLVYVLKSSPETQHYYPFDFVLTITYTLSDYTLKVTYEVENTGKDTAYFQIGAHPGFNLPVAQLDRYTLRFETEENSPRHLLQEGQFSGKTAPALQHSATLPLSKQLFEQDAIVLKDLVSRKVKLEDAHSSFQLEMEFEDFPYLGIWTKKDCEEFICLEPWYGCADPVGFAGDISEKESVVSLSAGGKRAFSWAVSV